MSSFQPQIQKYPDGRTFVYLDSAHLEECLRTFRDGDFYGVGISRYHGYEADDLEILKQVSSIRGLHIQDTIRNVSGLDYVKGIDYLLIDGIGADIDLGAFTKLRELRIGGWSARFRNLDRCNGLGSLYIYSYSPGSSDLSELKPLHGLKALELVKGSVQSLQGVESMSQLERLHLRYLTKLGDLSLLCERQTLEELIVDHCRKAENLAALKCLAGLRVLGYDACRDIESINFLKSFRALRRCTFIDTNIVDGNLRPLLEMPKLEYVGFLKKRHYSHTPEELEAALTTRR
jgi:hypothetical protein